ncbi:hypothetical protein T05_13121 [Trichinella murrelli]|uniref:Uncharacterized protein n=1 Tax=Trichinella murrelli TaxID=144512 RepID=A0A0V0SQ79_9BILA|nr:hypothetical protein T05_13121 [Trichinella murrelli]
MEKEMSIKKDMMSTEKSETKLRTEGKSLHRGILNN